VLLPQVLEVSLGCGIEPQGKHVGHGGWMWADGEQAGVGAAGTGEYTNDSFGTHVQLFTRTRRTGIPLRDRCAFW